MKSLSGIGIVLAEALAAYLWLALGYEAAGRVLIFYLWARTILVFFVVGIVSHPNFVLPKIEKSPRLMRYFHRCAIAVRVLGLAAINRPVLAGLFLIGAVLIYLVNDAEKPTAKSQEAN